MISLLKKVDEYINVYIKRATQTMHPLIKKVDDYINNHVKQTGGTDYKYVSSLGALTWTRTYTPESKALYNLHDTRMWIVPPTFKNWTALSTSAHHIVVYVVDYDTYLEFVCAELLGRVDDNGDNLVYRVCGNESAMTAFLNADDVKVVLQNAGYATITTGSSEIEYL
jgi:hypothetical protein